MRIVSNITLMLADTNMSSILYLVNLISFLYRFHSFLHLRPILDKIQNHNLQQHDKQNKTKLNDTVFYVHFFGDHIILNEPIENWPICDVLVAFFSKGYPLDKAKAYVALRKPFILNDLDMQEMLQDRRRVYDHLEASGIDVPRHVYLSRDGYVSTGTGDGCNKCSDMQVKEFDDHIEVNGVCIHKPFVEKPVDAEGKYVPHVMTSLSTRASVL
jgi:hypothetical protein